MAGLKERSRNGGVKGAIPGMAGVKGGVPEWWS